jgi:hypothetical protein
MHTFNVGPLDYSEQRLVWAGIGVDLAFDGKTYRTYDASEYSGITFWVFGNTPEDFEVRISSKATTSVEYGGTCTEEDCAPCSRGIWPNDYETDATGLRQFAIRFSNLEGCCLKSFDVTQVTNIQFYCPKDCQGYDFWIDDLAFFVGETQIPEPN